MSLGAFVNGITPSFFLLLHLVGFIAAAYFAHRAFTITLNLAGWGFTLFALGELIYMTYHIDVTVLLFANTVATLLDVVGITLVFAGAVKTMRVVRITEIEQVFVEAQQFRIEDRLGFTQRNVRQGIGSGPCRRAALALAAARGRGLGLKSEAVGDLVQPGPDRFPPGQGAGLARQREKGRLENVLGIVRVVQDAFRGAVGHGTVPPDQFGKRCLVTARGKSLKQVPVGDIDGQRRQLADVAQEHRGVGS